ncbi:MAG: caspase domain-containing protein, partial [Pseudorhodoplanes sp.]
MILRVLAAFCLLFAALQVPPAVAQQRKAALVVGNGAYQHARTLPSPANDARAVADALRGLGFDVTLALDVDHRGMRDTLRDSERKLSGAQVATFYFAGYALDLDGENYLMPVDAALRDDANRRSDAISLTSVFDILDRASGGKLVILDANRSSPFSAGVATPGNRRAGARTGLAAPAVPDGSLVMMASAPGTVAGDGAGPRTPLTAAVVRHLTEPGIDVATAMRRVRLDVARATGNAQVPWFQSSLPVEIRFSDPPGTPANPQSVRPITEEKRELEERLARERAETQRLAEFKKSQTRTPEAQPAPPSPYPAPSAVDDQVERFPTVEAPDRVAAGATTTVLVSLTVDKVTPDVTVLSTGGGATRTARGALSLPLPADAASTEVKVVLRAAGFDLDPATPEEAAIEVGRSGDSTVARFRITARPDAVGVRALRVTLWRDNEFLANISRKIEIVPARPIATDSAAPSGRSSAARSALQAPMALTAPPAAVAMDAAQPLRLSAAAQVAVFRRPRPIDLKIEIVY